MPLVTMRTLHGCHCQIRGKDNKWTKKTLAQVGLFVIAVIGYVLGTGLIGIVGGIDSNGKDYLFPYVAWVTGAVVYVITVVVMWGW